jgi:ubiquinone/menaquinone biosynthesis C-methylase UbiE
MNATAGSLQERNPAISARSFAAGQSFITTVKVFWHAEIFPAVRVEYEHRAAAAARRPETVDDVGQLLCESTLYQFFAWFERHMQRFKYAGRYGLVPWHQQQRAQLLARLNAAPADAVELHPELEMPRYYVSCDIHQHPGGVWSDDVAGLVYERAASTTTPLAGNKHADLHYRFTEIIGQQCPAPKRVLDMGCGFGKSTRPIAEQFPQAAIDAVDLSAPCLKVAALDARNVRFRQMNAAQTDYPDAHFDLVTSTMFLHEMPPPVIEKTLAEAARVLQPGGKMVHLDFYHLADLFQRFIHYTHGRHNNEPFMEPLAEMDLVGTLERLGFKNIRIEPFEETDGALAPDFPAWRFPWTVIAAERI